MRKYLKLCVLVMCVALVGCSNKTISEDEAKDIALKDAQVEEKDVTFLETETDDDEYKFVFQSDTKQYEYEIDKNNGKIESKKNKTINSSTIPNDNTQSAEQLISQEEAKQIAFEHFQVNESDVQNLEIELDNDNIPHYEIEFTINLKEYSIKINAQTKEIMEKETDY